MFKSPKKLIIFLSILALAGGFALAVSKYNTNSTRGNQPRLVFKEIRQWQIASDDVIFYETFPNAAAAWDGSNQNETGWVTIQGNGDANDIQITDEDEDGGTLPPSGGYNLTFEDCDDGAVIPNTTYDLACVPIDLDGYESVTVEYYWQSDDPEAGEWLEVSYSTNATNCTDGTWTQIGYHDNPTDDLWYLATPSIPDAAAVSNFRLRFASKSNATQEHYYIDDVKVTGTLLTTISGTSADGSGTVKWAKNGDEQGESTTISASAWTISSLAAPPTTGDIITVWIDAGVDDAAESTAVTKYDGSGIIEGMVLDLNVLSIGSDDTGVSIALSDLGYDCLDDEDIMHNATTVTTTLEVEGVGGVCANSYTSEKIDILSGDTLTIGAGDTLTTHDIAINGTLTSGGASTYNISGSWDNNDDFNSSSETINFTSTTTETINSTGASDSDIYKAVFDGSGGQWTLTTALVVNNDFTITTGTITAPSATLTIGGSYSNAGTFTHNSGTVLMNDAVSDGTETLTGTMTTPSSFNNLTFNSANGPWTFATNSATVVNDFTITAGTITAPGSGYTLTIGGNYSNSGTFTHNSGTITFDGNASADQTVTTNGQAFHNFTINNDEATYDDIIISGALDVNNTLAVTDGDLKLDTNNPNVNTAGDVTIGANGAITKGTGTWTFDGTTTYTDGTSGIQDIGAITIGPSTANTTVTTATDMKVTSLIIGADDELDITGNTLTITGSGTPFVITTNGTFTIANSTVKYTSSSDTYITETNYHNLKLGPGL